MPGDEPQGTMGRVQTAGEAPAAPMRLLGRKIGLHFDDMAWSATGTKSIDIPYRTRGNRIHGTHGDFRSLLLPLSNSLTRKELQELKFLCGNVVPRGKLETINHGFELFEALEDLNKLSVRDTDFLESKLIAVNRPDLRDQLFILKIAG